MTRPSLHPTQHFVANELDGWNGTNRNHIDSYVPQQDLVDSYLPSFQACVEEGKVSGIMVRCVAREASAPRVVTRHAAACACSGACSGPCSGAHPFTRRTPVAVLLQRG